MTERSVRGERAWPWLCAAFACFYALTSLGYVESPDGAVMLAVTRSLVERGGTGIQELPGWPGFGGAYSKDPSTGRMVFYSKYGLGLSLAAIPGYAVGRALAPLARESEKDLFTTGWDRDRTRERSTDDVSFTLESPGHYRFVWYDTGRGNFAGALEAFFAGLTNAVVGGAIVAALYLCALELGVAAGASLALALLAGLATPLWHYARTFFAEPLAAFGVLLFLLGALRGRRTAVTRWWAASGAGLGVAVLAKPVHVVLLIPAGIYLALKRRAMGRRECAAWAAGFGLFVLVVAAYNLARFGSLFETGYGKEVGQWTTPFLRGLAGLLVSPGRGILIYDPLWIPAAWGFARFARRARHEAIFIGTCFVTLLATYASWHQWEGGWCWGPRFLLVAVPLLMLPAAEMLDPLPRARIGRGAVFGVVAAGLLVSLNGIIVHYVDYLNWLRCYFLAHAREFAARGVEDYYPLMCWRWDFSPLARYWSFEPKEPFLIARALRTPGIVLGAYAVFALGLGVSVRRLAAGLAVGRLPRNRG